MVIRTPEQLRGMARDVLLAAGADERNASRVAEALVSANLCGVDTHGVLHLPSYVDAIKSGRIVPTAWPQIIKETATTALVSGNWTFGHVAAKYAMEVAIEKSTRDNIAIVGVVQAHHIGRLGEYAELAASEGMVSLIWASGYSEATPSAVPYGGRKPVLGTNPLAMGFPGAVESPVILDFSTTTVAGTKIRLARERNEQVPPGLIVDKDGNPTTNPVDVSAGGALLPFGGHKGFALMVAVEILGRVLTGSDAYIDPTHNSVYLHQGVTMIVVKPDTFRTLADVTARADELVRRIRAVPPAPGFAEVRVPGDRLSRTRASRGREGIPVSDDIWRSLINLARSLGQVRGETNGWA